MVNQSLHEQLEFVLALVSDLQDELKNIMYYKKHISSDLINAIKQCTNILIPLKTEIHLSIDDTLTVVESAQQDNESQYISIISDVLSSLGDFETSMTLAIERMGQLKFSDSMDKDRIGDIVFRLGSEIKKLTNLEEFLSAFYSVLFEEHCPDVGASLDILNLLAKLQVISK